MPTPIIPHQTKKQKTKLINKNNTASKIQQFWKKMQPAMAVPVLRSHFKLKRPKKTNAYKGEWHSIHYASTCLLRQPASRAIYTGD
jgi:hypothetical protein